MRGPDGSRLFRALSAVVHAGRAIAGGRPFPAFASLEVTRRCERSCRYCASRATPVAEELTLSAWIDILDELAGCGTVAVSLTGGEPLERSDIAEIAAAARHRGMWVGLNTNGRRLPGLREVLERVDRVTLSLDGIEAINDSVRGAGAFHDAVLAIEAARAARVPVQIMSVLSSTSIPGLDTFLDLLREWKIPVYFQPAYVSLLRSEGCPNPERPTPQDLGWAIRRIIAFKRQGFPIRNSETALKAMLQPKPGRTIRCMGGRLFVRVTAEGCIEVCGLSADQTPKGIRARDGIRQGMRKIMEAENRCAVCESAVRAELNLLAAPDPGAWWERVRDLLGMGRTWH